MQSFRDEPALESFGLSFYTVLTSFLDPDATEWAADYAPFDPANLPQPVSVANQARIDAWNHWKGSIAAAIAANPGSSGPPPATGSGAGGPGARKFIRVTRELNLDSDGDGIADWWELWILFHSSYFLNPFATDTNGDGNPDGGDDWDDDGLTNALEYALGTNPLNADTDGDGVNDGNEVAKGKDPTDPASFPTVLRYVTRSLLYYYAEGNGISFPPTPEYTLLTYNETWTPDGHTDEIDPPDRIPFTDLSETLATELPFPSATPPAHWTTRQDDAEGPLVLHSGHLTTLDHICDEGILIQGRFWLQRDGASGEGEKKTYLKITERSVGGIDHDPEVETIVLEIPAGATISPPADVIPSFENDVSDEFVNVRLLPVDLEDVNDHVDDSDDVAIVPWDNIQEIEDESIAWIDAHTSEQNSAPRMPQLEFKIPNLPNGVTLEAKLLVEYERPYAGKQPEDTVKIPADGSFKSIADGNWQIWDDYDELPFFGGDAVLTYKAGGGQEQTIKFAIGGENPEDDKCKEYTQSRPDAPWFAYVIEKHESQAYNAGFYNQFWDRSGNSSPINGGVNYDFTRGDPLKVLSLGETGVGGTGLAQVTGAGGNKDVPAARAVFWNWQENVDSFLAILSGKIQIAETFMNDESPRSPTNPMPNGQRPQTAYHTGNNVPVPSRDQAGVTFGDNAGETRPEDAVAIKAYNGAAAHWCSWQGPTTHSWQWNYGQYNYVEKVCELLEEE